MINRNIIARQKSALLGGAAVNGVFDQVFADAAVMQQRGAFARRSIAGNFLSLLCSFEQEINELKFGLLHLPREGLVARNRIELGILFIANDFLYVRRNRVSLAGSAACINAERTAVRLQLLYIEHSQPVRLHDLNRADQGEIGEVLVVDRVELIVFNQTKQVRKLERQNAFRLQQDLQPFHKVVEVRHLRQDVVAENEVGATVSRREFFRQVCAEEAYERRNSFFDRRLGDVGGRLNSEYGNVLAHEVLQQVAIVAGHFDDETLLAQAETRLHLFAVFFAMLQPRVRK